jgi:hypothetical protein
MLSPDETISITVRKHWFAFLRELVPLVFLSVLPFFLFVGWEALVAGGAIGARDMSLSLPPQAALFCFMAWALIMWMRLFVIWSDHYLDMWIVTDKRVIDVEQVGFFRHKNVSCELHNIQNITIETKGFYSTVLDFGTIDVETAGETANITIRDIPKPEHLRQIIVEHIEEHRKKMNTSGDALESNNFKSA